MSLASVILSVAKNLLGLLGVVLETLRPHLIAPGLWEIAALRSQRQVRRGLFARQKKEGRRGGVDSAPTVTPYMVITYSP